MSEDRRALPSAGNGAPDMVDRAFGALGWLARGGWQVARRLPGGEMAERQVRKVEQALVSEVRKRLDESDPRRATAQLTEIPEIVAEPVLNHTHLPAMPRDPLRAAMAELLDRSVMGPKEVARDYLFVTILRQLVPDEARILSALSDGAVFPLVNVLTRTSIRGERAPVLQNASTVGKAAGVLLPALTPLYVTRLLRHGLVEVGEEDTSISVQYELLFTDDGVRAAEDRIRANRRRPVFDKHSLRSSELGRQFWHACDPTVRALPPGGGGR